jgi:hypothetical protein
VLAAVVLAEPTERTTARESIPNQANSFFQLIGAHSTSYAQGLSSNPRVPIEKPRVTRGLGIATKRLDRLHALIPARPLSQLVTNAPKTAVGPTTAPGLALGDDPLRWEGSRPGCRFGVGTHPS